MKSQYSFYLNEEVKKKIEELSEKDQRSESDFLNLLLIKMLKVVIKND